MNDDDISLLAFILALIFFCCAMYLYAQTAIVISDDRRWEITTHPYWLASSFCGVMAFLSCAAGLAWSEPLPRRTVKDYRQKEVETTTFSWYWKCDYCMLMNNWEHELCSHCGSPRGRSKKTFRKLDEESRSIK